jgi:hypothetical protein
MSALAPIPGAKLALLIPRLASNHDGEVVATARAIYRTLEAAGRDFHDLAALVDGHDPTGRYQRPPDLRSGILDELLAWPGLTDWEVGFVRSIRLLIIDNPSFVPSPKQHALLNRLLRNMGRAW